MATYIKASLERSYAESFLSELERNENQYFFFIGRSTPWTVDNSPPTFADTFASEYEVMNNIIGYKKITPESVYFALPRYQWTSGTTYDQYDDTVDLFDDADPKQFYIITDENKIYKCLGNSGGVPSTVKPTEVFSEAFAVSDGYRWKYLASVRESDLPYELSDYLPIDYAYSIDDLETSNQYNAQITSVPGTVDRIVMSGSGASGVSAGVYSQTISGAAAIRLAAITEVDSTTKTVTITDSASRTTIGANPALYAGYILKIASSTVNASEINNYGVITNGVISGNSVIFTVKNDAINFSFTAPSAGNAQQIVTAEILPYVKIVGDGNGAYAFAQMTASKTISSVVVGNGGRNYSKAGAEVITPKTATTLHPTLRIVLSPKEGHGSNILKELNVKDVLVVVQITESDLEKIRGGGSYRQFGIIKNPVLSDGSGVVAGTENNYFRDITLVPENSYLTSDFDRSGTVFLLGDESFSSAKVSRFTQTSVSDGQRVLLKTIFSSDKFVSRAERANDYVVSFASGGLPSVKYGLGETVTQSIPSGTVLQNGAVYGYDIVVDGTVIQSTVTDAVIRVSSGGNFVPSTSVFLTGVNSGITAQISTVEPRYGEYVRIGYADGEQVGFVDREGSSRLYKVDAVGKAYYDSNGVPSYRGLHLLEVSTSVSGATGGVDVTSSPLTQTSFSNGDVVSQGSTAAGSNYAAGVVYDWEFVNSSYGRLYVTGVTGRFLSVETHGLTGTTLSSYILAAYHEPEISRNSGEILYIDNVRPITRTVGQKEEFRLRLGF